MTAKTKTSVAMVALLLLASCRDDHTQEQQPEATTAPGLSTEFRTEAINATGEWTRVAYVLTDTKTGRTYLLNAAGGTPVEMGP